jgi:ABC-type branched-subunit amino acid transport system ATPase component
MTPPLIRAEDAVAGHNGLPIAGPFSLHCERGDAIAVTGSPGSGKSTILQMLMGRAHLLGGRCEVMGRPIARGAWALRPWSLALGVVWSARDAPEGLKVAQLLRLAGATGSSGGFVDPRVAEWVSATPLARRMAAAVGVLSGGERTVLAMACALARSDGGLLIVDDLSASLQPSIAERMVGILAEDVSAARRGIVFTEGNSAIAGRLATKVVAIREPQAAATRTIMTESKEPFPTD